MAKTVVIVDDTVFMRMTLKKSLESFDYEVVGEGSNGFEAVSLYKRHKPDLITMDITMPKKDGLEAVKEIIAIDAEARIIMVSAMGQKSRVIDAITAGAKDFIVKPFRPDRVAEALERLDGKPPDKEIIKNSDQDEEQPLKENPVNGESADGNTQDKDKSVQQEGETKEPE